MPELTLSFDDKNVRGSGQDEVGAYFFEGNKSEKIIKLKKSYE